MHFSILSLFFIGLILIITSLTLTVPTHALHNGGGFYIPHIPSASHLHYALPARTISLHSGQSIDTLTPDANVPIYFTSGRVLLVNALPRERGGDMHVHTHTHTTQSLPHTEVQHVLSDMFDMSTASTSTHTTSTQEGEVASIQWFVHVKTPITPLIKSHINQWIGTIGDYSLGLYVPHITHITHNTHTHTRTHQSVHWTCLYEWLTTQTHTHTQTYT